MGVLVCSRRKKLVKAKLVVDVVLGSPSSPNWEDLLCVRKRSIKTMLKVLMVLICSILITQKIWPKVLLRFWIESSFCARR